MKKQMDNNIMKYENLFLIIEIGNKINVSKPNINNAPHPLGPKFSYSSVFLILIFNISLQITRNIYSPLQ